MHTLYYCCCCCQEIHAYIVVCISAVAVVKRYMHTLYYCCCCCQEIHAYIILLLLLLSRDTCIHRWYTLVLLLLSRDTCIHYITAVAVVKRYMHTLYYCCCCCQEIHAYIILLQLLLSRDTCIHSESYKSFFHSVHKWLCCIPFAGLFENYLLVKFRDPGLEAVGGSLYLPFDNIKELLHGCLVYSRKCCNDIDSIIIPQALDPISVHTNFVVCCL